MSLPRPLADVEVEIPKEGVDWGFWIMAAVIGAMTILAVLAIWNNAHGVPYGLR